MKTYSAKERDIERSWHVVDAEGKVLGRLATEVAKVLRGKHKPTWTPNIDTGDHVIILNADKIVLKGKKGFEKVHRHYTGYPGGLREVPFERYLQDHPDRVIKEAVWGMIPKTVLGRQQFKKLRVYRGTEHPHEAQQPKTLEIE